MTGPKYRKIALNGRPLSDEKPQHTAETDQVKEESYIDALNLGLRHNTTDVYIPLVGDQLTLSVRRNLGTEIVNSKSGLTPAERIDLPFGVCWSSNVLPHVDLVQQEPTESAGDCLTLSPNYVNVTDDTGSSFRFLAALVDGGKEFLACPSSQLEVDNYQATLALDGADLVFTKKFGTSIRFVGPVQILTIPSDSTDPSYAYTESHIYYRATRVQDRFGLGLDYFYPDDISLIPTKIQADTGQKLTFVVTDGRITKVTDPMGNETTYTYDESNLHLTQVHRPEETTIEYTYVENIEEDPLPPPPSAPVTTYTHWDVTSITTDGATYSFAYSYDTSKRIYSSEHNSYYTKAGEPMWVSQVTLPNSSPVTFSLDSLMKLIDGGFDFEGHRNTSVTDAEGFVRNYSFSGVEVTFLNNLDADLDISAHGNPLRPPKMVIFETMTVEHVGFGTETFEFAANAGMALSSITDLCGNTTTFEYNDLMPTPSWAVG